MSPSDCQSTEAIVGSAADAAIVLIIQAPRQTPRRVVREGPERIRVIAQINEMADAHLTLAP